MMSLIDNIINKKNGESLLCQIESRLYQNGAIDSTDMEILSLIKMYDNDLFSKHEKSILSYMGVFYKNIEPDNIRQLIFSETATLIQEKYSHGYTPLQACVVENIQSNNCYSFSAPTSTGKSYVFMNLIRDSLRDVVVIVPSRALINEYLEKLKQNITDKSINILPFIDKVNKEKLSRSIFVVTPERARNLFARSNEFDIEYLLFDEAQLGDEKNRRGMYYDSIIRRCQKAFPDAKYIFAQPFVSNPQCQITKNKFNEETSEANSFLYRNVGQLYMCYDEKKNEFYHFALDKDKVGSIRVASLFNPIEKVINDGGSVLVYSSKKSIINNNILRQFKKYIDMCTPIENDDWLDETVDELKSYLGCQTEVRKPYYSEFVNYLKRGIIIHHGSLPLYARTKVEQMAKRGLCRLCFATSTLEQGINMPFDIVYVDRLESHDAIGVRNLIGRAGRSTSEQKFDYGVVILGRTSQVTPFRKVINKVISLDDVSTLDSPLDDDNDLKDFKDSINEGRFIDEYNMTPKEIKAVSNFEEIGKDIQYILDAMLDNLDVKKNMASKTKIAIIKHFEKIYTEYLGRDLAQQEHNIFEEALLILFKKIEIKSFKCICQIRYRKAIKVNDKRLHQSLKMPVTAAFITGYNDIPNKNLPVFSLFSKDTRVSEVSYDRIVCDTYDYIDKLLDFRLSDIFYAAFSKYYEATNDERAKVLCKIVRYGTSNEREIMMLRYGMSFEDIEALSPYISEINENHISVTKDFYKLPENKRNVIERFI